VWTRTAPALLRERAAAIEPQEREAAFLKETGVILVHGFQETTATMRQRSLTRNAAIQTITREHTARNDAENAPTGGVVSIQGGTSINAKQGIPCFVGVSESTCGAHGLAMQMVIIPPGGKCVPHLHIGSETALYVLQGQAETVYGPGLSERAITGPGDFLYIAPGVPHCARNLSDTEPVVAITARTDANDQERVEIVDIPPVWRN
jgi:uncharacterized RmlC-like cupin family protein